ncbi:transporter [Uliginosibacterium sp. H3]|uniref:Transporter n=1 Tax=Uliginosibacterium silvisoli TaxID=3114758 RepID=A0ABU6K6S6_9RHOO|nr:transporter [Uliginosibacterium sp. H3]
MKPFRMSVLLALRLAGAMTLVAGGSACAQQLEPRAYAPLPVDLNVLGLAAAYSRGDVAVDPSVPISNAQARLVVVAPFYAHSFDLLGRQAGVSLVMPIADINGHGELQGQAREVKRTGLGDPVMRFSINLLGSPALTAQQFATRKRETILGASLSVVAPLGDYDSTKLVNLGSNRWAFKPELGLSQPVGDWDLELYAGVWLFTDNDNFYGGLVRKQEPMMSTQSHVVYTFQPGLWASFDFTYYVGGATTVGGKPKDDRNDNSRAGLTLALPVARQHALKLSWSRGVTVRIGQNFTVLGASWSYAWF